MVKGSSTTKAPKRTTKAPTRAAKAPTRATESSKKKPSGSVEARQAKPAAAKKTRRPPRASALARRRAPSNSLLGMLLIGGATLASALLGRAAMKPGTKAWYRTLKKPSWTPPDAAFGIVWPVLYGLSAYSAWRVWRSPQSKERSLALRLWGTQMLTNAAWTPLFFAQKRPLAALGDIGGNVGSAASYALAAGKIDRTAGLSMIPYVAWVGFATSINASVVRHNGSGLLARLTG